MKVLSERQVSLLTYIYSANRGGFRPTSEQVERWLDSPKRRTPVPRFAQALASSLGPVFSMPALQAVPGTGETDVEHAIRMEWVEDPRQLTLTALGRALLIADDIATVEDGATDTLVLDREDPLAYARLMGEISGAGAGLLVDPYLRLDQLHDLVINSTLSRILISKQYKGSTEIRSSISTYLANAHRPVEVRASADTDVHDRILLSDTGTVQLIGYSLNGIREGVASTTVVKLPDVAAQAQAEKVEEWWRSASAVEPVPKPLSA